MQAVCYRKEIGIESNPSIGKSEDELAPLSPGLFYPECGQEEMAMWTHWLPTSYTFIAAATYAIWGALQKWEAPVEVMDEFKWALNLQMFEEYAIRTPVRRDARDPLLLARLKDVWYRIALWGESKLFSVEEISSFVRESLVVKSCIAKRQKRIALWGTGLAILTAIVCVLSGALRSDIGPGIGLLLTFFMSVSAWMPMLTYKPENAQHDFLDLYRR